MKIESFDQTIAELFAMGYFKIPRFQRPYSWERLEVYLKKQTDWTAAEIRKRSDHLAKLSFDKVWKI
jgi:hypothetical protein